MYTEGDMIGAFLCSAYIIFIYILFCKFIIFVVIYIIFMFIDVNNKSK